MSEDSGTHATVTAESQVVVEEPRRRPAKLEGGNLMRMAGIKPEPTEAKAKGTAEPGDSGSTADPASDSKGRETGFVYGRVKGLTFRDVRSEWVPFASFAFMAAIVVLAFIVAMHR